jgi:hypothetical protein
VTYFNVIPLTVRENIAIITHVYWNISVVLGIYSIHATNRKFSLLPIFMGLVVVILIAWSNCLQKSFSVYRVPSSIQSVSMIGKYEHLQ